MRGREDNSNQFLAKNYLETVGIHVFHDIEDTIHFILLPPISVSIQNEQFKG